MIEIIKKIVEEEMKKLHIAEIGEVTSIFPHSSDGDKDNYECNVKLKNRDLELRRVPVATQHIGLANIPNVGDLVLLTFLNGDINAPIIIGRLYTSEDRPPVNKEKEIIYIPKYPKNSNLRRIHLEFPGGTALSISDGEIILKAGKTKFELSHEKSEIHTKSGHKIVLDESKGKEKIEIKDKTGNNSIVIDSIQNTINISSQMKMSIQANMIEIEAQSMMTIKAGATLTLQGALVKIN
jgi:phage baseplate assembly protein gpV